MSNVAIKENWQVRSVYTQRLETFKTALASRNRQKEQITLVRTLADKNTSLYSCLLNNGKLVVRK